MLHHETFKELPFSGNYPPPEGLLLPRESASRTRFMFVKFFLTLICNQVPFFRRLSLYMNPNSPWSPQPVAPATTLSSKPLHHLSEGTSMIGNYFARLTGSKRNLLALLASSVVLTAGCANMSSTAPTGGNP